MKVPKIDTNEGKKPLTALPDEELVTGFIYFSEDQEEIDLVLLLRHATTEKEAAKYLRACLENGRNLVPVYPGEGDKVPKGAEYIGSIPDGVLYIV